MNDDLIRRSDAIEAITYSHLDNLTREERIAHINALPSADRPQEWIPCSERLPSEDEYVIVSVLDDYGDTPWKYTTVAWLCNGVWISDNYILCGTAIAWMPLPKPWKGADDE